MASTIVAFQLGEREVEVMVKPLTSLQAVLRYQLGMTAVKEGCRQGGCGSCAVLVDGQPVMSCLVPIEDVAGKRVTTLESLSPIVGVSPLQQAFIDAGAFQCGYCTPGMIVVSSALLGRNPRPSRVEIIEALGGNVCRCTGYEPIVAAVAAAAQAATTAGAEPAAGDAERPA